MLLCIHVLYFLAFKNHQVTFIHRAGKHIGFNILSGLIFSEGIMTNELNMDQIL